MVKEIKLADRAECTGCMACHDACPTNSITTIFDGLHRQPLINADTCISCGKCQSVCAPLQGISQNIRESFTPEYLCAWNEDSEERFNATSGGVGGALAKRALELGWYVCGAAFDDEWQLSHIVSNDISVLEKIRGSKYLQSDTSDCYKEIVSLLKKGEKFLFLGTPCQTEAIRRLAPSSVSENLLTCEIICHGVNSPIVWEGYKTYIEKKHQSPLKSYNFRSKSKGWGKLRASYTFQNGKKVDDPAYRNIFHSWFGQHYMMRESCFRCKFRTEERHSDIVIGDFWGVETIEPSLDVKAGASVLIVNSENAKTFVSKVCLNTKTIEASKAKSVIKGFVDKMPEEVKSMQIARMKKFTEDYQNHTFEDMTSKLYPRVTTFEKYFNSILYHLHLKK